MDLPTTMRAAVYHGKNELAIEDLPMPDLGAHDLLLEVSHCGICGSDLHFVLEGWGRPGSVEGHEFSGRVVAVGSGVERWKVGDALVGGPTPRCGECEFCRAGRPSLCSGRNTPGISVHKDGAFAEYVRVHEDAVLPIPDGVGIREAALAEPLAVALHGLTQGRVEAGQRILVTGAGPIGTLSIAAARARGVTDIVVSEPHPRRRALAEQLGASTIEPEELVTPPMPSDIVDEPFDVALECSGHRAAMESALGQLKRGGRLVLVGAGMQQPRFDPNRILLNELEIKGSFVYDADGFDVALGLLARPDFPTDLLLERDDVDLDDLYGAIEGLAGGELAAKVLVVPREGDTMTSQIARPRRPRFNHVAMSLPSDLLGPDGRADILKFYVDVFGWEELPTLTEDNKRLVMSCYTYEQFVFLIADDPPMVAPRLDHFGMSVATEAELDEMLDRAKKFQKQDDRVDIIDKKVDDYEVLAITSFYVRYLLPMMVEVQWWDFKDAAAEPAG